MEMGGRSGAWGVAGQWVSSGTGSPRSLTDFTWISLQRETDTDSQASGGSDSGDWIFTIREKDPKSLENGALQPSDLERNKVMLARTM